ncbi:MAG: right-handed parallel beta-helix repeat-containing protein, partial [Patescibacteria group bacterium]
MFKIKKSLSFKPRTLLLSLLGLSLFAVAVIIYPHINNLWQTKDVEAAGEVNIYYSVGQNTNDHKTGSPTITISGNTATFSVAQTATNIGVGDQISYGNASATTTVYISAKVSSTTWNVITRLGAQPTATTTATVLKIAHAFRSLNAAVGGDNPGASNANHLNATTTVAGNYILNIPCYYDSGVDSTAANIYDWTTSANNYIRIYTPISTSTEANFSQRHIGVRNLTKYLLSVSANYNAALVVAVDYIRIEGLQIRNTASNGTAAIVNTLGASTDIRFVDTISFNNNGAITAFSVTRGPLVVFNNVIAFDSKIGFEVTNVGNNNVYCYNCSAVNNSNYGFSVADYKTFVIKNSYAGNNTIANFYRGAHGNIATTTSASSDGSLGTAQVAYSTSTGAYFSNVTAGSENLNISSASALKWSGTNLSLDSRWINPRGNKDIAGINRPESSWSIGTFDLAFSGAIPPNITSVATSTTATTTTVTWTTDQAATSMVYYATQAYYDANQGYNLASSSSALDTNHSIVLHNLSESTQYHFYVSSANASSTIATSSGLTFTTDSSIDSIAPTVDLFAIPATSSSLTVNITSFTASDTGGSGLAGYLVNESASIPALSDPHWETSATTTYTFSTEGLKTLYAWAKDSSGNISSSLSDQVLITLVTYYIDYENGLDTNNGLTTSTPWKHCPGDSNATNNPSSAILTGGANLVFKGGVSYIGLIRLNWSGSIGSSIVYDGNSSGSWGTGKAIIDGNNSVPNYQGFLATASRNYITIRNFEIINQAQLAVGSEPWKTNGIRFEATNDNIIIQDNYIHNVGYWNTDCSTTVNGYANACASGGMSLNLPTNCLISNNEITRTGGGGIGVNGPRNTVISNNEIHDYVMWGVDVVGDSGPTVNVTIIGNTIYNIYQHDFYTGPDVEGPHLDFVFIRKGSGTRPSGVIIDGNLFYNNYSFSDVGGTAQVFLSYADDTIIRNNVFINPHSYFAVSVAWTSSGTKIYNNTFYLPRSSTVPMSINATGSSTEIINNLAVGPANGGFLAVQDNTSLASISKCDYNLFLNTASPVSQSSPYTHYSLSAWQALGFDLNSVTVDDVDAVNFISTTGYPDFSNLVNLNVQSTSPAIDNATTSTSFATDKMGTSRPQGPAWDIGAYEYVSTSTPIVTFTSTSTTATTATINFTTAYVATSTIYYGEDANYGTASTSNISTTSHSITLHNLTEYTGYHFYIE